MNKTNKNATITKRMIYDAIISEQKSKDGLVKKVNDIHKIIYGNGNTDKSLIHKIATISTTLKIHWALFLIILSLLVKLAFFS